MRNRMYGGVRGRKTKVGRKLLRFPPTRLESWSHGDMETFNFCINFFSHLGAFLSPYALHLCIPLSLNTHTAASCPRGGTACRWLLWRGRYVLSLDVFLPVLYVNAS